MAKKKPQQGTTQSKPDSTQGVPHKDAGERLVDWVQHHRRAVLGGVAAIAVIAIAGWFTIEYRRSKEEAASQALAQARFASQSGNLPLAANDLSRVISQFAGTSAADEAVIILAQVRLLQEQPHLAAEELRATVGGLSGQFKAPAYGLLGAALENTGNMADAASAYEDAARTSWYGSVSAQYLNDAARAWWAAADTTRAITTYEKVLSDYPESASAVEARVRIAELRAGAGLPTTTG